MRGLLSLMLAIPLTVGCVEEEDKTDTTDGGDALTGVWVLSWNSAGATFEASCPSNGFPDTYFSETIHHIEIRIMDDDAVVIDVGEFPEEYPCDLGTGAEYSDACLDENPYSTIMAGVLPAASSFTVSKRYGGMTESSDGSFSYTQWEFEISGELRAEQLHGEADMKIIDGDENEECRSQVKQIYTAEAQ